MRRIIQGTWVRAGWVTLVLLAAVPLLAHASGQAQAQVREDRSQVVSAKARAAVADGGRVRVMVALRPPATRAGPDIPGGMAASVARVEAVADAVLGSLPPASHALRRRFSLVPALALEVDARGLAALARHPQVLAVDVDAGGSAGAAVEPDEASHLNAVAGLQALGLAGAGRKVAVIDSGVDLDHPDLAARIVDEACFCSPAAGGGGCCPAGTATQAGPGAAADNNGHGSNVAGIIVGEGRVAPRGAVPDARLVAVKVLDANGRFCCSSDVVAAMDWIATRHPDVAAVNLSLGSDDTFPAHCDADTAWTRSLATAVDALVANGAVVTVSTGNQGRPQQVQAPACVRNALAVAATWDSDVGPVAGFLGCSETATWARKPTCFSNRGATTDLFAAGAFVRSTSHTGGVSNYGGTSQAAPMAAACAVALSQAAPAATVAQRMDAMVLSTTRIEDPASNRVYPFLDCFDALALLEPAALGPFPVHGSQPLLPPSPQTLATPLPPVSAPEAHGPPTRERPAPVPRAAIESVRGTATMQR